MFRLYRHKYAQNGQVVNNLQLCFSYLFAIILKIAAKFAQNLPQAMYKSVRYDATVPAGT